MSARTVSAARAALLVVGGLLAACASVDAPAPPPGGSAPAPLPPPVASSIAVPFTGPLGLAELERIANDLLPRGGRPGMGRRAWHDIEMAPGSHVRLAFWRDDVVIAADGARLRTTARLYFMLALDIGGVSNVIECGSPTAPGVATLPLVTTFAWHPEWRLVPTTVAGPPEVTSPCSGSSPGVDPTAFLTETLRRSLAALATQIDAHLAPRTDFRAAAARYWERLAEPIPLGQEAVLRLNPRAAAAAPVVFTREAVATEVSLVAYPEVVLARGPSAPPLSAPPLPALGDGAALERFVVNLRVIVPFAAATAALRAREPLPRAERVMEQDVRITDLRVYGSNREVALAVSLDQPVRGTVYLTGRPAYHGGRLALDDFNFQTESRQALLRAASGLLHGTFRDRLGERLSQTLGERFAGQLGALRQRLEARLNRPVAERLSLTTVIARFGPADDQQPAVAGDDLVLPLRLEGTTRLVARP